MALCLIRGSFGNQLVRLTHGLISMPQALVKAAAAEDGKESAPPAAAAKPDGASTQLLLVPRGSFEISGGGDPLRPHAPAAAVAGLGLTTRRAAGDEESGALISGRMTPGTMNPDGGLLAGAGLGPRTSSEPPASPVQVKP